MAPDADAITGFLVMWGLVVLIAASVLFTARHRAQRMVTGALPQADKLARLRRRGGWTRAWSAGVALLFLFLVFTVVGASADSTLAVWARVVGSLIGLVGAAAAGLLLIVAKRQPRGAARRIEAAATDGPPAVPHAAVPPGARWQALGPTSFLIGWFVIIEYVPRQDVAVRGTALLVLLVLAGAVVGPYGLLRSAPTSVDGERRDRFDRLAAEVGVRIRDFRVWEGQTTANAAQFGLVPGLKWVMITQGLLDGMADDEVDAVVGHELGHARRGHLVIALVAVVASWFGLQALVGLLGRHQGSGVVEVLSGLALLLAVPVGLFLVTGLVGIRLEQDADDAAARWVGVEPTVRALRRLRELNGGEDRVGLFRAMRTQHPGVAQRVARLEARAGAGVE